MCFRTYVPHEGIAFFGATPEEAEREALAYLGYSEPAN
jgi:hypothetical protein